MSRVLGWDPVRKQFFPLSRPCLLVQPTSPALSPWKPAADFLLVGGRRRGGGREGWLSPACPPPILRLSPLLRPPSRGSWTGGDPCSPQS